MLNYRLMPISLIMFDGDGGADGNGNSQGVSTPAMPTKKGGEFDNVVFGKQPEATAGADNAPEPTPEQRQADFDAFIEKNKDLYEAKFKGEYSERFEKDFSRRFRDHKTLENKFNQADEIVTLLGKKYGMTDINDIKSTLENDTRLVEERALENGLSPEQQLQVDTLEAQLEAQKRRADSIYRQQQSEEQYRQWVMEANELKTIYPEFDLTKEIENPKFKSLLKAGIPVQHAYEVANLDAIKQNNAISVASQTSKATADNIRARGNRPKENAGSATPGVVYKSDVSKLTPKDRREIARRVARGEKISF